MKHLLALGIFGILIGGPYCAFAKAEIVPSISQRVLSQQSVADMMYQRLDSFIANPSTSNGQTFYQWLSEQPISKKEEQLAQVISLCNLGFYERRSGDSQRALQYYSEGWNIYNTNQLSGFDILESCLKPLGNLYTQVNALSEAQQIIELYIFKAQETGRTDIIPGAIANLSVVYQNQGNFEKAIKILQEGLKHHPKHPDLLTNLATNLLASNHFQAGLEAAKKSLAINPNQPNIYRMRAQLYAHKEMYQEAIAELERAYMLQKQNPRTRSRELAKTQLSLAEIYASQKDLNTAKLQLKNVYIHLFENSVPVFESSRDFPEAHQLFPENTLMDALDLHAHIAGLENNYPQSIALYEYAAYVGDLLNTTERDQQSRLIMQSNSKRRIESFLEIAYDNYLTKKDQTAINNAFLMIQKATAAIVSETYIRKSERLPYQSDAFVIDLERREKKQANWQVEVYESQKEGIPNLIHYAAILDSINQNGYQIKKIQKALRDKYPALKEIKAATLTEVQSKARKKEETIVSYFMGSKAVYQFVISGNEITLHRLTRGQQEQDAFKQACIQFIHFFKDAGQINNDPKGYARAAVELFEMLHLPEADRLIIIPDSFLQFIPFDALLTTSSRSFQYQEMPYLFKRSALSYVLSPLLYMQEDVPMTKNPLALGIFPVFEGTSLELTYSLEEANALEKTFDGELLMHADASTAAAFAKAGNHQILHFSTHASGGSFEIPASLQLYDTQIPVQQLYGNQWQADLVVLSACETGIGTIISGEGAQSLARGFQYAGARNIAFTLWQVNDRATAQLMSSYYKHLKQTHSRNTSLHLSKSDYLNNSSIPNTKKSPYYWAAFVYYGTTDVSKDSNSWIWWVGVGILALFLGFLLKQKHGLTA